MVDALHDKNLQPLLVGALTGPHGTALADSENDDGFTMLAQLVAARHSEATGEALRLVCPFSAQAWTSPLGSRHRPTLSHCCWDAQGCRGCHALADSAWDDVDPFSVLSLTPAFSGAASALPVGFLPHSTSSSICT